ncbi:AFG1-like ATPase isoform X2 [Selaginella moellendorffii]|nr:AFG1-like ATPase isoform X2 [Selaginella moellendorffii]|eukprot:XP_024527350.1 AFG1-like ATPase isoform X2 [Selaginella moellendorffii]
MAFLSIGHLQRSPRPSLTLLNRFLHELHGAVSSTARIEDIPVGTAPLDAYHQLVKAGTIRHDNGQLAALQPLERLHRELQGYEPATSANLTSKFFSAFRLKPSQEAPKGVYIYGGVGTGKSLVQDIFFHCSPVRSKRRVHFHQFMLDVHKRLHEKRLQGQGKSGDLIELVARDLLAAGWLLCFDEFQVIDIADAMILRRLLENLFRSGAVMVASSNRAPSELYKNGLQRDLFLPCIELIKSRCEVHVFRPNSPDYRLIGARPDGSSSLSVVWHMPLNEETSKALERSFLELAGDRPIFTTVLKESNRAIFVPRAAGGIAYFTFYELCGTFKGAADYIAIAASFHTVFIAGIPRMTRSHAEMARRFITLVDVFYEHKVKLIVSADAQPGDLYLPRLEDDQPVAGVVKPREEKGGTTAYEEKDEEFAFARTVSRLNHMQSVDYLSASWAAPGKAFICHLQSTKLQEGDLRRIWDRYNINKDTKLSRDELLLMMEDLTDIKCGHRNVPEELLEDMYKKLDANGDGDVVWEEFRNYFLEYGLETECV